MIDTLIIGYGSAGKNHESVLNDLGCKTYIYSKRNINHLRSFKTISEVFLSVNPKYIVIANETSEHLKTLKLLRKI